MILCYLAAVAAGSTEGTDVAADVRDVSSPPGDRLTSEQLPDAIAALQNGDDIDYERAAGAIDMDEAGDPTAGVYDAFEYTPALETTGELPVAEKPEGEE